MEKGGRENHRDKIEREDDWRSVPSTWAQKYLIEVYTVAVFHLHYT